MNTLWDAQEMVAEELLEREADLRANIYGRKVVRIAWFDLQVRVRD